MKLKKRFILILLLIIIISLTGFIFRQKNVKISNIFNKQYEEGLVFEKFGSCNEGYADYKSLTQGLMATSTKTSEITNGYGEYFHIINDGNENYFLVDGCKWGLDAFLIEYEKMIGYEEAKTVCSEIKTQASGNNDLFNRYNDSICVKDKVNIDYRGENVAHSSYGFEKVEFKSNCSIKWDQDQGTAFDGALFYVGSDNVDLESYIDDCGCTNNLQYFIATGQKDVYEVKCGTTLKNNGCKNHSITDSFGYTRNTYYFNGVVKNENCSGWESEDTDMDGTDYVGDFYWYKGIENGTKCYFGHYNTSSEKTCDYVYDSETNDNLYLVDGCTWDIAAYMNKCAEIGEPKCGDSEFKKFLTDGMENNNWISTHVDEYNKKCSDKIEYGTIIINQNEDAWGYDPSASGWERVDDYNWKKEIAIGRTISGPDVSNLKRYGIQNFKGWSTDSTCASYNSSNSFYVSSTGTTTYYACYEGTTTSSKLFNSDGSKKTIDDKYTNENNTCDNTKVSVTDSYYRRTTKIYAEALNDNPYCNVVCEDNVTVNYPSIFETVPAGQYFELMYEPEITANRTCTSEFDYDKWKTQYIAAQTAEIEAMDALNKAQANYDAASALTAISDGTCGCCSPTCVNNTCDTKYKDTQSANYYTSASASTISTSKSASGCGSSAFESSKSTVVSTASTNLATALQSYKDAVNNRLKLERNNLQCYTILDQDNNNEKKYEDVFIENYTEITNINNTKYAIKTPKVEVPTTNDSTSSTYATYITSKIADMTNDIIKSTSITSPKSTVNFYAVYPKLTFSYDDGREGAPTDTKIDQVLDAEAHVKLDTGAFTSEHGNTYTKDATTAISYSTTKTNSGYFYVDGNRDQHIEFNYYTAENITRQVQYYFTYHESDEYLSKVHSGATILKNGTIPSGYESLSRKEKVTNKTNTSITLLNHVYPVSLKAVTDDYDIKFKLDNYNGLNITGGSNYYFNSDTNGFFDSLTGNYKCSYEITNDILTLSDKKENFKDLKSNTIFRSVATSDLDPNDRSYTGKLGENWINPKGVAAKKQIEATEGTNGEKNTYNPDNLEYSFTLTPTLIRAIKCYNQIQEEYDEQKGYDDFKLTCAPNTGGRECVSEFLTNLAQGRVDINGTCSEYGLSSDVIQSNYSSINSWGIDNLSTIRKMWKYFKPTGYDSTGNVTGTIEELDAIYNNSTHKITESAMDLDDYLKSYSKWGVLP